MLRPSSVRDASTCLRCNLRLVLRQIQQRRFQSSDESPPPTQEFPAFPSAPTSEQQHETQPTRLRLIRYGGHSGHGTHLNNGRIRGKKGGQRRVESSESLSISSLGQDSEVIVLRDLHEPRLHRNKPDPHTLELDDAEPKPPVLTASDIQNMSGRRAIRPQAQEVFESIEDLRPVGGVFVVTKDEFQAKFTALAKGYTIGQLKGYLVQKNTAARLGTSNAKLSSSVQQETDPTEITTGNGELQDLKRTAWHVGTTPITKRLPMVNFSIQLGRKMNNKEDVIEAILRHAWTLGVDEEKTTVGELEFLLSPMQFGLLLTKNSRTLQPLLESSKFYKNSRFQLHQAEHVIRVVGPQAEAEAIAHILTEAYAPAKSVDMDLETFDAVLISGSSLQDIFSSAQLTRIMQLTRTFVRYDVDAKRLQIASFADVAINDAHRLLLALLDMRRRGRVRKIYDSHNPEDCRLEPVSTTKDLPSFARYLNLGRWVTSSSKHKRSFADQTPLDAEHDHASDKSAERHDESAGSIRLALNSHSPIIREAFATMDSFIESSEDALDTDVSIWPKRPPYDFWKARIGLSLHNDETEAAYPDAQGLQVYDTQHARYQEQIFTYKVPGLVGLLSSIPYNDPQKEAREKRTRLLARLVPSPLEQAGVLSSTAYPVIQVRFYVEAASKSQLSEADVFADLPDGKRIVFQDMRAIIRTDIVQLNLPSHPADMRFEREQRLVSRTAITDAGIRSFVDAIFQSMKNDAVLRAPPALQIPIPQTVVKSLHKKVPVRLRQAARGLRSQAWSKEASKSGIVPVKYLFAGFEYQESRDFDLGDLAPHHRANIRSTEAGVTGGRSLDLSLLYDEERPLLRDGERRDGENGMILQRLLDASVNVVNALAKSQVREPKIQQHLTHGVLAKEPKSGPYSMYDELAKKPREKVSITHNDRFNEREQRRIAKKQAQKTIGVSKSSRLNKKVAEQDKHVRGVTLDRTNSQKTIKVEKPASQTRVFDASAEQEHTEQTLSTETSTPTSNATESTPAQTPTQASPSPEPETQLNAEEMKAPEEETKASEETRASEETKAPEQAKAPEEAKTPEEEPLSVRLRRMMGGGV
jgi:hypothetical protein